MGSSASDGNGDGAADDAPAGVRGYARGAGPTAVDSGRAVVAVLKLCRMGPRDCPRSSWLGRSFGG